jgi:feruloyl esterase
MHFPDSSHENFGGSRRVGYKILMLRLLPLALFAVSFAPGAQAASPDFSRCETLANLALSHTTITLAQQVPAGSFMPPVPVNSPSSTSVNPIGDLPAFCRVAATARPAEDSEIKFEVWMPVAGWNGKFEGVGNGGWAGTISYGALAAALRQGYATASTNTGHDGVGTDAQFAAGHPEKLIDFGYRAIHEMTGQAKAIIAAYYGSSPRFAYFNGCSTGGRQALMEAQRFPLDYNGIAAGAPANNWTHQRFGTMWPGTADLIDPASYIPPAKYPAINKAALQACDGLDGVTDGIISYPERCHFDPGVITCQGADSDNCLTAPQAEAARKIYAGPRNPRTGELIFPGLEPGSELGWKSEAGGPEPYPNGMSYFRFVLFKNPQWDFRTLDYDRDLALVDRTHGKILDAVDPNLEQFKNNGGKLLLYHGWADNLIAPRNSVNYYQSGLAAMGGKMQTDDFLRLFMVPGMGHCGGGPGPSTFDRVEILEQWVEHGTPPNQIVASRSDKSLPAMTRPLCPYPQVAKWNGAGSANDAANFACAVQAVDKPLR